MTHFQLELDLNYDKDSLVNWFSLPKKLTGEINFSDEGPMPVGEDINLGFARLDHQKRIGCLLSKNKAASTMLFDLLVDILIKKSKMNSVLQYVYLPQHGWCRVKGAGEKHALDAIKSMMAASFKDKTLSSIPSFLFKRMIFRENVLFDAVDLVDRSAPEYIPLKQAMTSLNKIITTFYNCFQPLVYKIISKYISNKAKANDLFLEFRHILLTAAYRYAPEFNVSFLFHASSWIKSELFKYLKDHKEKYSKNVSFATQEVFDVVSNLNSIDTKAEDEVQGENQKSLLIRSLSVLNAREKEIIIRYFGIHGDPMNFKDIGDEIGVTGERVRQIIKPALAKLASGPHAEELRACLTA